METDAKLEEQRLSIDEALEREMDEDIILVLVISLRRSSRVSIQNIIYLDRDGSMMIRPSQGPAISN